MTIAKTVKINGVTYKVTKIGKNAFKGCKYLKKITIGSNVKKIEKRCICKLPKTCKYQYEKGKWNHIHRKQGFQQDQCKSKSERTFKKLSKYTRMLKKAGLQRKRLLKIEICFKSISSGKKRRREQNLFSPSYFFCFSVDASDAFDYNKNSMAFYAAILKEKSEYNYDKKYDRLWKI